MELRLQPKPEVEILPADKGIVSRKEFFVKKKFEQINQYFFPGHFIRKWKPKAELIYPPVSDENSIEYECDFNRDVQNCFVEDYAEEVFLRTPPPCFVVIGKFGNSVSKLSRDIAEEFGSVLIQVDDIVNEVIKRQTETSKLLDRILRLGVSLTLNYVLALLSYVAHTAEARHRGYVLCGLPSLPLSGDLSADQQFNYLFTWENKPTVFINVLFEDEDLIKERTNLLCELKDVESEKHIIYHSEYEMFADEDETEEDDDDEFLPVKEETSYEHDLDIEPSRPWVKLPRNEENRVWLELELFDNIIRPAIELIGRRVDPQYFITVDSRVRNEFEVVMARLSLLQIWKAPSAVPFIQPKQSKIENEEKQEEEFSAKEQEYELDMGQIAQELPQTAFLKLFTKKTISPKFRWELSHYNYVCPVSLREGEIIEGKSEFAVLFMKYIYFLRDEKSMNKFLKNPRVYVLPVRPRPLCRFFILGHPFSGKTSLAKTLSVEFSVPLIDLNAILKNDLERKKNIYQEFCRQKAECREIIRLTSQAWRDWRMEEEQRISLIEDWVLFIQILLCQRINEFYSVGSDNITAKTFEFSTYLATESSESTKMSPEDSAQLGQSETAEEKKSVKAQKTISKVSRLQMPSAKIIQDLEVDMKANLFLSSLWISFSGDEKTVRREKCGEGDESEEGNSDFDLESKESDNVNWCSLLPPQSLSSFLINKKVPYTTRERRESFKILLDAASKVYWEPSALKTEFSKWRLPCFMDINLCEFFLDNPMLLLKYLPDWLKERPLIPDPVDAMHPSVLEQGRKAFLKAGIVTVKQNQEEVGILLRDAIEKAERGGLRVTGEVISPGGWIVDNMSLDLEIWKKLFCEKVFFEHVYILIDTEPDCQRIINLWWELYGRFTSSEKFSLEEKTILSTERSTEEQNMRSSNAFPENESETKETVTEKNQKQMGMIQFLLDGAEATIEGDQELDELYRVLQDPSLAKHYAPPFPVDSFSHNLLQSPLETLYALKEDSANEEALLAVQTLTNTLSYINASSFFCNQQLCPPAYTSSLGPQLEVITDKMINFLKKKSVQNDKKTFFRDSSADPLEFLISLLSLPAKLKQLKNWLTSIGRGNAIYEIEITGKTREEVFTEIRKDLMAPLIKKPRELEGFEIDEIIKSSAKNLSQTKLNNDEGLGDKTLELESEYEEDLRIFGESGPLCIVNLERGIFLVGKPNFVLRYYGKLYYFWNQDAKIKFMENPEKYAPYYSAIRCYPPLRVYIMGPIGSGKSTLAESLANQCSVNVIDYIIFLSKSLIPHSNATSEKFSGVTTQSLLISEGHNEVAKLAKENFMHAPYTKRQFWLENFFYSDLLAHKKFLEKVINLTEPPAHVHVPTELTYRSIKTTSGESYGEDYSETSSKSSNISLAKFPYESMKEIEIIISNYIEKKSDLTDYCVEKSLKNLWTQEPYISQGFVLEGFPMQHFDIKNMMENNWIPDLIVEITLPEEQVIERNIDNLMEMWETKLKQETIEEKLLEDALTTLYKVNVLLKRNELIKEKRNEAMHRLSSQFEGKTKTKNGSNLEESFEKNSDDFKFSLKTTKSSLKKTEYQESTNSESAILPEEVDVQIEAEVDEILKDGFPPMVFNPIFETYEAGRARIIGNLIQNYKRDSKEIEKVKAALKHLDIPWLEIDGLQNVQEILNDLFIKFDEIKNRQIFKGEFAFPMKTETAEELLRQGYYFLSKFGKWCPVQVYRMKNSLHMFRPLSKKGKITPIAYRNYIYFVGGENEKKEFVKDPIKYTFNTPHHPNIPLRVAVIGPPKSGKSTLCNRLGTMFDLKVVTMGTALRFALEAIPRSTLARTIRGYLQRGCFLPLSLKVEALMVCLNDPSCATQGFVFDGVPFDAALTQSLAEKGKLPFVIISLIGDSDFGKTNRQNLDVKKYRLPYKNRTNLDTKYKDWNDTYKRFAQWNQNTYSNLYEVNAKLSIVDIFYKVYDIIRKSFFGILYYVEYCISDRVLPLQYLCVSQHEYELRKSSFHNNCPVCWVELNRLSSSSDPPPRSGLVQYLNHFYWICPKHTEKFSKNPKMYFPPNAPKGPELLPKKLRRCVLEKNPGWKIHGFGRCPVTKTDFPSSLDWEGSSDFAAFYNDEVFLCKNQEMLDRFLARPWRYCQADTHFEVNRPTKSNAVKQLGPPKMTSLPAIGFLEQTVADLIHECLQILGMIRPVYPNMTPTVTGCIFVGLYFKVHNKKKQGSNLDRYYLNYMLQHCRAYCFRIPDFMATREQGELGQGDFETDVDRESESSDEYDSFTQNPAAVPTHQMSLETFWLDFESRAENKMWSAANLSDKYTLMRLTSDEELVEILDPPRTNVILKYQTYKLRLSPIPPVINCLTFLYSNKQSMEIPGRFNYNTLYQPLPLFSPPNPKLRVNPDKKFSMLIYSQSQASLSSNADLHKTERAYSNSSADDPIIKTEEETHSELIKNRFVPRFQVLDRITKQTPPKTPKVVETEPISFDPYRNYTYTLLYSHFFRTSHVLKCFEWNECQQYLEYCSRLEKNLGLANVQVEFFHTPRKPKSLKSRTSVDSYQEIFDAACTFVICSEVRPSEPSQKISDKTALQKSSLANFMELLILEKLDELFDRVSSSFLSYDTYELNVEPLSVGAADENQIVIQEVLPYPPLLWDIDSKPYHAYRSLSSIFQTPPLDNIAHERHVSLLDGLTEVNDHLRFVPYPSRIKMGEEQETKSSTCKMKKSSRRKSFYLVYDFFNLPWTSFLTYPHFWAYNVDITERFCEYDDGLGTPLQL